VLVEFLVELVDFLADGVPGVNNGRRRGVHSRRNPPCGRSFSVSGERTETAAYGASLSFPHSISNFR
jgi:hypothetical protein